MSPDPSKNAPSAVAHVRDAPKVADCERCNCSIAGGVSDSLLRQFRTFHDHGDES